MTRRLPQGDGPCDRIELVPDSCRHGFFPLLNTQQASAPKGDQAVVPCPDMMASLAPKHARLRVIAVGRVPAAHGALGGWETLCFTILSNDPQRQLADAWFRL